jgi:hypothetical protein
VDSLISAVSVFSLILENKPRLLRRRFSCQKAGFSRQMGLIPGTWPHYQASTVYLDMHFGRLPNGKAQPPERASASEGRLQRLVGHKISSSRPESRCRPDINT